MFLYEIEWVFSLNLSWSDNAPYQILFASFSLLLAVCNMGSQM